MTDCQMIAPRFDIYVIADVDALKREHAKLRADYAQVVHENAELHARLHRMEVAANV